MRHIFFIILLFTSAQSVKAQNSDSTFYVLTLNEGTVFTGRLLERNEQSVVFEDVSLGKLTLESKSVKLIEPAGEQRFALKLKTGESYTVIISKRTASETTFRTNSMGTVTIGNDKILSLKVTGTEPVTENNKGWFENPNATRYLFGPSAIPLKKGEGYYQNAYLIVNSGNVGITDNITVGGGLMGFILPFATAKVSGKVAKNVYAGGGLVYCMLPNFGSGSAGHAGIAFGVGTVGNTEHNVTGGLGYGFLNGSTTQGPIVTLSGMTRASQNLSFVSENWFLPIGRGEYYQVYSYALRIMGRKHSFDFGFLNNRDFVNFLPMGIPYVDYVMKF